MSWLDKILDFLQKNVPWLLLGYHWGKKKNVELKKENELLKLKVQRNEHEKRIKEHNANLSDDELRNEIIQSGRGKK